MIALRSEALCDSIEATPDAARCSAALVAVVDDVPEAVEAGEAFADPDACDFRPAGAAREAAAVPVLAA